MNEFKIIIIKLKEIIMQQHKDLVQTDKKVLDKDVAAVLKIKPATLASYKNRDKPPYKAILTYCHNNQLNVRKILFNQGQPIIDYPTQEPVAVGKIRVRYFKSLEAYARYLKMNVKF